MAALTAYNALSLDEWPLHTHVMPEWRPGDWFACEHPERPRSKHTWYDERCRACAVAFGAHAYAEPTETLADALTFAEATMAQTYEDIRGYYGLPPLPVRA